MRLILSDVRCVAEKGDKVHKTQGNRMAAIVIPTLAENGVLINGVNTV